MAIRYHITEHAHTSCGGIVITASHIMRIDGRTMALEGDLVVCPACNSTGVIVCVDPRTPESHKGRRVALNGDLCACSCSFPPVLLNMQEYKYQLIHESEKIIENTSTIFNQPEINDRLNINQYNQRFKIVDQENNPVSDISIQIEDQQGKILTTKTNSDGESPTIYGESLDLIHLYLFKDQS